MTLTKSSRENDDDQPVDCGVYSNRPHGVLVSFHLELLHKVKDLKGALCELEGGARFSVANSCLAKLKTKFSEVNCRNLLGSAVP